MNPLRRIAPWAPALSYMIAIWILSSRPYTIAWLDLPYRDKVAHALQYGVLSLLYLHAVLRSFRLTRARSYATAALLTSAWGYLDEIHQAFVPGRHSDVRDWLADTLGALIAIGLAAIVLRVRKPGDARQESR